MKKNSISSPELQNKEPIRVLFIGFSYIIKVYQAKLDALLKTGDIEVALLCPDKWKLPEWSQPFALKAYYPGIQLYPATISLFNGRTGAYVYPFYKFLNALISFRPDLIYVEQEVFSLSAFEAAVFARLFKVPLAIFCWENMDRPLSFIRRWTRKFVLDTAQLITPGNRGADDLLRKWGYSGFTEILPQLGVDSSLFFLHTEPKMDRLFSIGFVGRLVYEKGVDLILIAARILKEHGYTFEVVVCGVGPYEMALRELAQTLDISNCIIWLGERKYEDVPNAISEMDVLVLPSRTVPQKWKEQFGHVLIEAMAMGVSVLGSSSGAIPDVIGRDDLIFAEDNSSELADKLEKIWADKFYREQIVEFGLARVDKLFTNEHVANELVGLFRMLLSN